MNLLSKSYFTVLLIVLFQQFFITFASNVTREQKSPFRVLTSFLKLPWIDLNSTPTGATTSSCRNDIATVFESADVGEMWALKMLDAASKIPAGIFIGNIWDLGMFDECVSVKNSSNSANIQGQHCMISLSLPTKYFKDTWRMMRIQKLIIHNPSADVDFSLSVSTCLPSSCSSQDIYALVNASINNMPELTAFEVGVAKVGCATFEPPSKIPLGTILVILLFAMIIIFLLSCTALDFILRASPNDGSSLLRNLAKFSLYANSLKLFSSKLGPDVLSAIHGIRVLSIVLIVFGHRCSLTFFEPTINVSDIHDLMQSMMSSVVFTLPLVVDTFFLMSGFLMAYAFLKRFQSDQTCNILRLYLHRYMRLTPCIAALLLFTIFIFPYTGTGPIWQRVYEATAANCQKNWWTNILFVQNIVNSEEMCLMHTWYLAVEMQLFILSPIILYPLFYRPKLGLVILNLLLIASFVAPALQLGINRWSAFFTLDKSVPETFAATIHFYPMTYNRALPYLLGIFVAYYVLQNKKQLTEIQVAFNWCLASLLILFCGWASQQIQPKAIVYNIIWETIYVSVVRLGWSVVMAWVIYACTRGHGGFVTKFLSLSIFVPFSRLSYSIYLVHLVLQVATAATMRTAVYMTPFSVLYLIWGDLVLSVVIALGLCLCCESPIIVLEKLFKCDLVSQPIERDSMSGSKAGLAAGINKYLDLTGAKVISDWGIETITSKRDFWRIISDQLNTLTEGPLKTPAEWSKLWQNWRTQLLKIDGNWEARSKCGIRKVKLQLQDRVIALEKELVVFLAAVNCNSIGSTSFKDSCITRPKSRVNFRYPQHEDPLQLSISDLDVFDNKKRTFLDHVSECRL